MAWIEVAPPKNVLEFYNKIFMKSTNNSYVYHGFHKKTREDVILKYIPLKGKDQDIDNECSIQSSIEFKYVMPLHKIFEFDNRYRVLVMDVAKCSLVSGYAENFFHSKLQVYKIMYQIAKGLAYLHLNNILHGDIKPSNIVLMNDDEYMPFPRIIDFGHAQKVPKDSFCTCRRLTLKYSAPELRQLRPHSYPSDIYALGATFYFLITENVQRDFPLQYTNRLGPYFSSEGKALIDSMLKSEPSLRPTIDEVLNSNFFNEEVLNDKEWVNNEKIFMNTITNSPINHEISNIV